MPKWDAEQYLKFGDERTQPVRDLIGRIQLPGPRRIMDLGCGPGNSTAELRKRWRAAQVAGLDSSAEMIGRAREAFPEGMWIPGDAAGWTAGEPYDLVFSNAMLQWVKNHEEVCPRLLAQVAEGGALAFQVPAHYDSPLHREILDVSRDPEWADRMAAARTALTNHPPEFYYELFEGRASRLDIWETVYYHVLAGPEAVLEWFRGSGLRPFLETLNGN
ncbi:MAG TPA: methyltransferase domain-containing protein, partial [Bryobacteraceae bacterium]|nr:methyltransferase domain-containing protein [Bryobacteraceae bacterium]